MPASQLRRGVLLASVLLFAAVTRLWQVASTPAGLYLDEAFHLLRAEEILHGGPWPVFITGNRGYEPLIVYLAAAAVAMLGPVAWAGRLVAAWAGLLAVAATIRAGQVLYPGRGVGAAAGFVLATLLWGLTFSRFGSQPILAALAAAGATAAFVYGVRRRHWPAFSLSGLCLGLGLDGYLGFRLFPLALTGIALAWLLSQPVAEGGRPPWRLIVAGLAVAAGVAAVLYAPLAAFFLREPHWFWGRFGETTGGTLQSGQPLDRLLNNGLKTLGGLFLHGDENWRHNIAGRPALDAAQALFFLSGLVVSGLEWRRPASWTLWIWLLIGLSPSMVTIEAPHFGRALMALPAVALLAGLGLATLWRRLTRPAARGLLVLAGGLSTVLTLQAFWIVWPNAAQQFVYFEVQQAWLAQALRGTTAGARLYATPLHLDYYHELWPLEYLLGSEAFGRFSSYNGQRCTVLPAHNTAGARYAVIITEDPETPRQIAAAFTQVQRRTAQWRNGAPYLEVFDIPGGQTAQVRPARLLPATFGDLVALVGYDLRLTQNKLSLDVVWQTRQTTPDAYKVFVHLLGAPQADGNIVYAQQDTPPCQGTFPSPQWHADELIRETYSLSLPPDLPAGAYTLQIGWYQEGGARLPITAGPEAAAGDALKLETVTFPQP